MKKLIFVSLMVLLTAYGCSPGCQLGISKTSGKNQVPVAYIDSISPEKAATEQKITLKGHGADADGTIKAYRWRSNKDGDLNTKASFETSNLSPGVHNIYLKVQDNKGAWSEEVQSKLTITDSSVETPVVEFFQATPASIVSSGSSILSWSVIGAIEVQINNDIGIVEMSDSRLVSPKTTTVYTLIATNAAGSTNAVTQVQVYAAPSADAPPVINLFGANPSAIAPGEASTLIWSVSNASSVIIEPGIGSTAHSGSLRVSPSSATSYILTAINANATITASVMITIYASTPFAVTNISTPDGPASGSRPCPFTMDFSASITTNGPGIVTYHWEQSNGTAGPNKSITFSSAGTKTVSHSWKVSGSGNYWAQLRTLSPNEVVSIPFSVTATCEEIAVTKVTATGSSASGSQHCPFTINFTASITTNGPCKVTYYWTQSDGATGPVRSIIFSAAGTKTVNHTWAVSNTGTYRARLTTLTPNSVTAPSYTSVTVICQ